MWPSFYRSPNNNRFRHEGGALYVVRVGKHGLQQWPYLFRRAVVILGARYDAERGIHNKKRISENFVIAADVDKMLQAEALGQRLIPAFLLKRRAAASLPQFRYAEI